MKRLFCIAALVALSISRLALCEPAPDSTGEVRISLPEYNHLMQSRPRAVPAMGYTFGAASVSVNVQENAGEYTATVSGNIAVAVRSSEPTAVTLVPLGTIVLDARTDEGPIDLTPSSDGLVWVAEKSGSSSVHIVYQVPISKFKNAFTVSIPLPGAARTDLSVDIPGEGADVAIVQASSFKVDTAAGRTVASAVVSGQKAVQLSWRTLSSKAATVSRASYTGKLSEHAITWSSEFTLDMTGDGPEAVQLIPSSAILQDVKVDGKDASVNDDNGFFTTTLRGKGQHTVRLGFQIAVEQPDESPHVTLPMRKVPISRIELELPGNLDVRVNPVTEVTYQRGEKTTKALMFVPLAEEVAIGWSDAAPKDDEVSARVNSTLYQIAKAEDGVVSVEVKALYELTRGSLSTFELAVPAGADVTKVEEPNGMLSDWRVTKGDAGKPDVLQLYLNQRVQGAAAFSISVERPLAGGAPADLPLLAPIGAHRSRGMVAILSGKDLTLKPTSEVGVTRVGDNQLPSSIRDAVSVTVAHTYKYSEGLPSIAVQAVKPEHVAARFDASVGTLFSLGDVAVRGNATVDVSVKSGSFDALQLTLPKGVNVLTVTAPSMRGYKTGDKGDLQALDIQFTQEMEGQLRIEVTYELLLDDKQQDVRLPTLHTEGSEVEQGRIGVEALSAVEVQPAKTNALTALDLGELPQSVLLKSTNPILLAFKYARAEPAPELTLQLTRHRQLEIQTTSIDLAHYRTVYTADGQAITSAAYTVRNARSQFLRIALPPGSNVWSAAVNNVVQQPAVAEATDKEGRPEVLITILNSPNGFPVSLVYQTPVQRIRGMLGAGRLFGVLPRTDVVVTETSWDVFLPPIGNYGTPDSNMDLVQRRENTPSTALANVERSDTAVAVNVIPLNLAVPESATVFSFRKLYANQSEGSAYFSVWFGPAIPSIAQSIIAYAASAILLWGILILAGISNGGRRKVPS